MSYECSEYVYPHLTFITHPLVHIHQNKKIALEIGHIQVGQFCGNCEQLELKICLAFYFLLGEAFFSLPLPFLRPSSFAYISCLAKLSFPFLCPFFALRRFFALSSPFLRPFFAVSSPFIRRFFTVSSPFLRPFFALSSQTPFAKAI
jgi:hypothetical protein